MPELTELKAKAKEHEWLEEANDIIEDPMADSFDHIKEVIETGMELPPSPKVEKILGELSGTKFLVIKYQRLDYSNVINEKRFSFFNFRDLIPW